MARFNLDVKAVKVDGTLCAVHARPPFHIKHGSWARPVH
jgi:hypothetical protein